MGHLGGVVEGFRWYQLTQNLPLASGTRTATSGPSSAQTEESESSCPGDKPLLLPVIQLAESTGVLHTA